jgi:hypothetical protein
MPSGRSAPCPLVAEAFAAGAQQCDACHKKYESATAPGWELGNRLPAGAPTLEPPARTRD